MTERLFTPAEVNALIPELSEIVRELVERHGQAQALALAIEAQKRHIQVSGGTLVDRREWKARAERLDGLTIEVRGSLQRIQVLGGTVKDLAMGLVDFPGLVPGTRGREPVNLCWKYGETAVRFWHGFDEGYAHRKPLP